MAIKRSGECFFAVALAAIASILSSSFAYAESAKVDYPQGYRYWTHVKSLILLDNHPFAETFGGLHHVYANKAALEAMQNGTPYPDGSVLVFDLMEAITDAEGGTTSEGPRIRLDVMQKDAALFPDTSGWGYETFFGPELKRIITDPIASCHGCHSSQESKDFVFSVFHK